LQDKKDGNDNNKTKNNNNDNNNDNDNDNEENGSNNFDDGKCFGLPETNVERCLTPNASTVGTLLSVVLIIIIVIRTKTVTITNQELII
jgi:hypothetical protein